MSGSLQELTDDLGQAGWVERPWGRYSVIDGGSGYQVKVLVIDPDHELSLQLHRHRREQWIVVSGVGRATLDGVESELRVGDQLTVPVGMKHRLGNPGVAPFKIIEVQFGDYLGEDDIERFEDRYGRV
jgi:mannose-6-phosphate isomerase-like protein (cupin superfamily)